MKFAVLQHQQLEKDPASVGGYAYAWAHGLYPSQHDGATWHVPFRDQFEISEEETDTVLSFLDEQWLAKTPVTFYDLEARFGVHGRLAQPAISPAGSCAASCGMPP